MKLVSKETLQNQFTEEAERGGVKRFIGKVRKSHAEAVQIAFNKAVAHREYGFHVRQVKEGFVIVGRKKERFEHSTGLAQMIV